MMSSNTIKKINNTISTLRRVFAFAAPYKRTFYLSIFLSVLLAATAPLRPYLIQETINEGIKGSYSSMLINGPGAFIIQVTILQILLLFIETAARFYFTFLTASLGQNVVMDLRNTTYSKIIHLNLRQFDTTPIGALTTRTISDIESINDIFSDGLIPIIADLLSIISVLLYMFFISWKITLVCLLPFPLLIIATYFFKESVNRSFTKVRNTISGLNAFVQEHLTGISVIQAFAAEKREEKNFSAINKQHRDANIKAIFAYSVFFPVVELVSAISIGLLVWWSAKQSMIISSSEAQHIAGIIPSFILCINLLFRPLRMIADKFNVLQMGMIAGERVFKVLDNEDVILPNNDISPAEKKIIINGKIVFENVWFAYVDQQYVLKDISLNVNPGETIAIVGSTGSGKTSIVNLINRLYEVNKGKIIIDNQNIVDYDIAVLRSNIAVVLQDVFLFSGSVLDNITLRNKTITQQQVEHASKLIGLHDFIMKLPGGYEYNVMERGATLSMGQRQLISFARAILFNPSILILDEATSSIDQESERLIQQAIEKMISGRTAIIVAHRLSTIRKASTIIVMDKGEILEMDSHEVLYAKKGQYYQLCQSQFSENNTI